MDLRQQKLTSEEWDALERPVNKEEHRILQMINQGYLKPKQVSLTMDNNPRLFTLSRKNQF